MAPAVGFGESSWAKSEKLHSESLGPIHDIFLGSGMQVVHSDSQYQ